MLKKLFSRSEPQARLPGRPFRFGVSLSGDLDRQALVDTARMVEELGYETFSISDHLHPQFLQLAPFPALAIIAENTRTIGLETLVLANDFRHPVVLANEALTLHKLSGGRFTLGIGAGWFKPDYSGAGIPFYPAPERVARVKESVEIIAGLQGTQPFSFQGEYYDVNELSGVAAAESGKLPLLIGGSGPVMLSFAARKADIVSLNPGLPLTYGDWRQGETPYADVTDRKLQWICKAAGPRVEQLELQALVTAGGISDGDVSELLGPILAMMGTSVAQTAGCPHFLAGTVEQCIAQVRSWRERWGVSYITFPHTIAESMAPLVAALRGQ